MTVLRFSCLQAGLPEKYHKLILHHIIRHCYKKCRASCPSRIIPAVRQSSFGWQYRCVTIFGTLALFVLEAAGKLGGKAVFVFVGVGGHGGGWRLRPSEKTKGGLCHIVIGLSGRLKADWKACVIFPNSAALWEEKAV